MKCYGLHHWEQIPLATRHKIEQAGGKCVEFLTLAMDVHPPYIKLYLPDETQTTHYGYLLPGNVPLYVEDRYEIYYGLIHPERILVRYYR